MILRSHLLWMCLFVGLYGVYAGSLKGGDGTRPSTQIEPPVAQKSLSFVELAIGINGTKANVLEPLAISLSEVRNGGASFDDALNKLVVALNMGADSQSLRLKVIAHLYVGSFSTKVESNWRYGNEKDVLELSSVLITRAKLFESLNRREDSVLWSRASILLLAYWGAPTTDAAIRRIIIDRQFGTLARISDARLAELHKQIDGLQESVDGFYSPLFIELMKKMNILIDAKSEIKTDDIRSSIEIFRKMLPSAMTYEEEERDFANYLWAMRLIIREKGTPEQMQIFVDALQSFKHDGTDFLNSMLDEILLTPGHAPHELFHLNDSR